MITSTNPRVGAYVVSSTAGESVRAYVPPPLPPMPPLDVRAIWQAHSRAELALGRLDGLVPIMPPQLADQIMAMFVRKEAVLSSQIEGTQSSLADLLQFESAAGVMGLFDDVVESSNYVGAMTYGMERLATLPLSLRLIRELHKRLLASGRGAGLQPGEFRKSQNWIGGSRPGNAAYVPPPVREMTACLGELEQFMHEEESGLPPLVKAGLLHLQFESIHPFLDGNGRIGRLLITLYLCVHGVLRLPLLFLSLYLKQHRDDYYRHLQEVRTKGAWEAWLLFFLAGVEHCSTEARSAVERILKLLERDRVRIALLGRRGVVALRVHDVLKGTPYVKPQGLAATLGLQAKAVNIALADLEKIGVVREVTGRRRGRLFEYRDYVAILNENTEPLPR